MKRVTQRPANPYAASRAINSACSLTIDTNAHTPTGFPFIRSVDAGARRGWLEKGDVLNTSGLAGLQEALRTTN